MSRIRRRTERARQSRRAAASARLLPVLLVWLTAATGLALMPQPAEDAAAVARELRDRHLAMPVAGIAPGALVSTFDQGRPGHRHEALDIMAPRGTPVLAVEDGTIVKLFWSVPGGRTIYQFDPSRRVAYYYAHLDGYAPGLAEGQAVRRGDTLGFVGSTGNADPAAPHLHFAIFVLTPARQWWNGTPIDPFPILRWSLGAAP